MGARWIMSAFSAGCVLAALGAAQELDVHCETIPLAGEKGADLGGRFLYQVEASGGSALAVESTLLVLDEVGQILDEVEIEHGDILQIALRDEVLVEPKKGGMDWLVHAPGVLIRAMARDTYRFKTAYCGPFAAIRLDQPPNLVFPSTPVQPEAPVFLEVALAQMVPGSVVIEIDGVDVLDAAGATVPGGPFSAAAEIAGETVAIEGLVADLDRGKISFALLGLPGGAHTVSVSGTPMYAATLPPGSSKWNRPLGALSNEQAFEVFRVDIELPSEGEELERGSVLISGRVTHGAPIDLVRVHGSQALLPPEVVTPGHGALGETHSVEFATVVPLADLLLDFATGADLTSAVDPGVNFVSVLATDAKGNAAVDRQRFSIGTTVAPIESVAKSAEKCGPVAPGVNQVESGFATSLSARALSDVVAFHALPSLKSEVIAALDALVGQSQTATADLCGDESDLEPTGPSGVPLTCSLQALNPSDPNTAPFIGFVEPVLQVGITSALQVPLTGSDLDGDPLEFHVRGEVPADAHLECTSPTTAAFVWFATCDQVDQFYQVEFVVSDGADEAVVPATIHVVDADTQFSKDFEVQALDYNHEDFKLSVEFPDEDTVRLRFDAGDMFLKLNASDCFWDCLFACCIGASIDVEVSISSLAVTVDMTPQQVSCGLASGDSLKTALEMGEFHVDVDPEFTGLLPWTVLLWVQLVDFFSDFDELIATAALQAEVKDTLENEILAMFPEGSLFALPELGFSTDIDDGVPLEVTATDSKELVIQPGAGGGGSISFGWHTEFVPTFAPDPEPKWVPTPSGFADAVMLGADLALQSSDDSLNQMFSALTATGVLRGEFSGLVVGHFIAAIPPELQILFALLGITLETPILLTLDLAQDAEGTAIPPLLAIVDDDATEDRIELKVRTQLLVRGILERDLPVGDDRELCPCLDFQPTCLEQPCLLFEDLLKLNILVDATLPATAPADTELKFVVTEIQQLAREEGFAAYETGDLSSSEDEIVATSADSPLLAALLQALNANLPSLPIPAVALTIQGAVQPENVRLFAATLDGAGQGLQDYFGVAADVGP